MSAEGLFGPESVTWRINGEAAMLLGGGRALILQMAHPHIGAAVDQHSSYGTDYWPRLRHTLRAVGAITFGDTETAERTAMRVRHLHARFEGTVAEGRLAGQRYDATDSALVLWVWATLVDSAILAYQQYVRPLALHEIERYYDEQRRFAAICGAADDACPATYEAFRAFFESTVSGTLEATPAARTAAGLVMNPAQLPALAAPLLFLVGLPTAGALPQRLRDDLGIPWSRKRALALRALAATARGTRRVLPGRFARVRSARDADRRVASAYPVSAIAALPRAPSS